jgi:hypothetical protein
MVGVTLASREHVAREASKFNIARYKTITTELRAVGRHDIILADLYHFLLTCKDFIVCHVISNSSKHYNLNASTM